MRHVIALGVVLAGFAALPAAAQSTHTSCHAYAEAQAYDGAKHGYAARYQAAYSHCTGGSDGYSLRTQPRRGGYFGQPRPQYPVISYNCPPGAPKMYRGTLYCATRN